MGCLNSFLAWKCCQMPGTLSRAPVNRKDPAFIHILHNNISNSKCMKRSVFSKYHHMDKALKGLLLVSKPLANTKLNLSWRVS